MIDLHNVGHELADIVAKLAGHRDLVRLGHELDALAADIERTADRILHRLRGLERRLAENETVPPWRLALAAVRAAELSAMLPEFLTADLVTAVAEKHHERLTAHRLLTPGPATDEAFLRGTEGNESVDAVQVGLVAIAAARARMGHARRVLTALAFPIDAARLRERLFEPIEPHVDSFWPRWSVAS